MAVKKVQLRADWKASLKAGRLVESSAVKMADSKVGCWVAEKAER